MEAISQSKTTPFVLPVTSRKHSSWMENMECVVIFHPVLKPLSLGRNVSETLQPSVYLALISSTLKMQYSDSDPGSMPQSEGPHFFFRKLK